MKTRLILTWAALLIGSALLNAQDNKPFQYNPSEPIENQVPPPHTNYSLEENWVSLPWKVDPADQSPEDLGNKQDSAAVDVFFVYPTIYAGRFEGETNWNAHVDDTVLNKRIQETTIRYQASVFNGAGKIYSPYYCQAHLWAYFTPDKEDGQHALDYAYEDVKNAFQYYLDHWNNGRPIIIAGHSQGSQHAAQLLRDYFDGKPLEKQLVAAYIPGMPIPDSVYTSLKPCETPEQTGCYCTWQTVRRGLRRWAGVIKFTPVCTNPLTWCNACDSVFAPRKINKGALLDKNRVIKHVCDAQTDKGVLWIRLKPILRMFIKRKDFHVGDINLFYYSIYENAIARTRSYLKATGSPLQKK